MEAGVDPRVTMALKSIRSHWPKNPLHTFTQRIIPYRFHTVYPIYSTGETKIQNNKKYYVV